MLKTKTTITWKIGGEAGFGIMSTGEMFARACMRAGLNVFTYPEYPSLIRGGHNTMQVTASAGPVSAHATQVQLLIALNRESVDLHLREMAPRGIILFDSSDKTLKDFRVPKTRNVIEFIGLPLESLVKSAGGVPLMRNTVALGASAALLGFPASALATIVRDMFGHKGEGVVKLNNDVLMAGFRAMTPELKRRCVWRVEPVKLSAERILLTGNEALALGAIQAGCQFFSGYPMTPATSILQTLAKHGPTYGILVRHAEDEIGAIHHAIGAAYAGARAMTATSGGGFALMTEGVGLAAMAEVGIVIVNAQRPGPSTGMPTWTEQGDLRQVLHASQGDFPRIVLAPSSHVECFTMIQEAFNLAEVYQTPVIVLTDKYLAEAYATVRVSDLKALPIQRGKVCIPKTGAAKQSYLRYAAKVADGIAPRSLPGTPGALFLANSDEHDEFGYSNEEADNRLAQVERRARKIATLRKKLSPPRRIGPVKAPLTVVSWGSSALAVEDALRILERDYQTSANAIILGMIAPFPAKEIQAAFRQAKRTVCVEMNRSGKLAGYLRERTGLNVDHSIRRFDGRPFDSELLAKQFARLSKSS